MNDKFHLYTIAQGSLTELQNQLLVARDVGYLAEKDFQDIARQSVRVHKLLNGLKRIKQNTKYEIPNTKYGQKAFTLIEALVYIAIFTILVTATAGFLSWAIRANAKTRALRETADNVRRVLETLAYEIRSARALYLPTSTPTQISLETRTLVPAGEALGYEDLYQCGARVCLKREGEAPLALTAEAVEVTSIRFTPIATTTASVRIAVSMRYKNPGNQADLGASVSATTTAAIRGY